MVEVLTNNQVSELLKTARTPRHKVAIALMADTGVRVSELVSLRWEQINFQRAELKVNSLKKRKGQKQERILPLTRDCINLLADLYNKEKPSPTDPIFPGKGKNGTMRRESINRLLSRTASKSEAITQNIYPHLLRHTYASKLNANGANLADIQNALGHEDPRTSSIYTHTDTKRLREILAAGTPKKSILERVKGIFSARTKKALPRIASSGGRNTFLIGRQKETQEAAEKLAKSISIVITGPVGIGKNAVLDSLTFDRKSLVLDDTKNFKKSVLDLLLMLFDHDKEELKNAFFPDLDRTQIINKLNRENLINLCLILTKITDRHEYILKVNDLDGLTPTVAKSFEVLKKHFVIATTSRGVAVQNYYAVSDFHQIELQPLNRTNALKMFANLAHSVEFEDFEHAKNQVWTASQGNPRTIAELLERFEKEGERLEPSDVETITAGYIGKHVGEFDASLLFLSLFALGLVAWVWMNSANFLDRRLAASIIGIVLLFGRYFTRFSRRKFV